MRRIGVGGPALLAAMALAAAPAQATFHLEKVNEVMLASSAGDASVQFVELLDRGGGEEQFTPVFGPYRLVVYDGAGTKVGEHMLNPAGLRSAASAGDPYLVSTPAADAAFGVTGDERLDVALPRDAGQACFEANVSPPAISCLTWGTIAKKVATNSQGSGSAGGPAPPDGQSEQRLADDSVVSAPPTPKAANKAGTPAPGDGDMTAAPFAGVSFASKRASVRGRRALVRLRCPKATSGSCAGRLVLRARHRDKRLGSARFDVPAGASATVRVSLTRAARRALRRHGRLAARARATARDGAGTAHTTTRTIVLRRG